MINRSLSEVCEMICATLSNSEFFDARINGVCLDTRIAQKNNLFVPIKGEFSDGHNFIDKAIEMGCSATLWQKDMPNPPTQIGVILVDNTADSFYKLASAYRESLLAKFIGITGSNGKTSTKDIVAGLLSVKYKTQKTQKNLNTEWGMPLTILSLDEDCEMAVIEMGLDRKGDLLFVKDIVKPHIGVLTNVGRAHLEGFNCVEEIAIAKLEMLECILDGGTFIYNGDDKLINGALSNISLRTDIYVKTFGFDRSFDLSYKLLQQDDNGLTFETSGEINDTFNINMVGQHQMFNCAPAIMIANQLGLNVDEIKIGLKNINHTGLRNEMLNIKNSLILNDSYKSNPESLTAALETLESLSGNKKIAVLGDMLGLGINESDIHIELGKSFEKYNVDTLVVLGDLGQKIAEGALGLVENIQIFSDKTEISDYLRSFLEEDCTILFKASRSLGFETIVEDLKK